MLNLFKKKYTKACTICDNKYKTLGRASKYCKDCAEEQRVKNYRKADITEASRGKLKTTTPEEYKLMVQASEERNAS